jgi:hypothetical protein
LKTDTDHQLAQNTEPSGNGGVREETPSDRVERPGDSSPARGTDPRAGVCTHDAAGVAVDHDFAILLQRGDWGKGH